MCRFFCNVEGTSALIVPSNKISYIYIESLAVVPTLYGTTL